MSNSHIERSDLHLSESSQAQNRGNIQCCIVGCGPAGAMLGLLLARQGVNVIVLEKHGDFLRDFRGDTIHPSTMQIMGELGLADRLLQLPHSKAPVLKVRSQQQAVIAVDFRHLKTRWPYITLLPQWDFLNFLTEEARRYPTFHLLMNAEGQELLEEDGVVCGVRYRMADGLHEVRAALTVAADGRSSCLREQAQLPLIETAPPMDVLWFRLSRRDDDTEETSFTISAGHVIGLINRREYWQIAYAIAKGSNERIRAAGLEKFKQSLQQLVPQLADRVDGLQDWEQVKLLVVQANRLKCWHRPGFLCIGDAAHAMSPIGGIGINLAIQDAVVAANVLAKPLKDGQVREKHLASIQRSRAWQTWIIQTLQSMMQRRLTAPILNASQPVTIPVFVRALLGLPGIRNLPARIAAFGVWPVHVKK